MHENLKKSIIKSFQKIIFIVHKNTLFLLGCLIYDVSN
jgi:hypothetical protein